MKTKPKSKSSKSSEKTSSKSKTSSKVVLVKPSPRYVELPLIFSGPDSNQLWDAIGKLGGETTLPGDVWDAIYQLASAMQSFEQRLATFFKKEIR